MKTLPIRPSGDVRRFFISRGSLWGCVWGVGAVPKETEYVTAGKGGCSWSTRHPGLLGSQMEAAMPLIASNCLDSPTMYRAVAGTNTTPPLHYQELSFLWTPATITPFQSPAPLQVIYLRGRRGGKTNEADSGEDRSQGAGESHAPEFPTAAPARLNVFRAESAGAAALRDEHRHGWLGDR